MKVAECLLCGKFRGEEPPPYKGEWVKFSDYQPIPPEELGHPEGLEYYCDEHLAAAQALTSRSSKEALIELQKQFGCFPIPRLIQPLPCRSWWRRLIMPLKR